MVIKGLTAEFKAIKKEYESDDKIRESIISISREILKPSKQAIYAIHRDDLATAKKLINQAKKNIQKARVLLKKATKDDVGAFRAALEEYVESVCYLSFVEKGNFPTRKQLGVTYATYLPALCDCSGELARRAVKKATSGDIAQVKKINSALEDVMTVFLALDFRSGEMRKKFESLKYNIAKTQDIMYDVSMKGRK